jgi:hypothetical protein
MTNLLGFLNNAPLTPYSQEQFYSTHFDLSSAFAPIPFGWTQFYDSSTD